MSLHLHWSKTNKTLVDQPFSVYKCTSTFVCVKTCGRAGPSYLATILSIYFENNVYKNYIISEVVLSFCFEELAYAVVWFPNSDNRPTVWKATAMLALCWELYELIPNAETRGHIRTRKPHSRNHFVVETQQCILCVVVVVVVVKYINECCTTMLLR